VVQEALVDDFLAGQLPDLAFELDVVVVHGELQAIDEGRRVDKTEGEGVTFFRLHVRVATRYLLRNAADGVPGVGYRNQRHGGRREQLTKVAGTDVTRLAGAEAQVGIHFPGGTNLPGGHFTRTAVVRGTHGEAQIHCFGKLDAV